MECYKHPSSNVKHLVFDENENETHLKRDIDENIKMILDKNIKEECSENDYSNDDDVIDDNDSNNNIDDNDNSDNDSENDVNKKRCVSTTKLVKHEIKLHEEKCRKAEENICILRNHLLAMVCVCV
jgi:hypothetical protein